MKNYQRPEAEIIMFIPDENITDTGAIISGGTTNNNPWGADGHDAAHGE